MEQPEGFSDGTDRVCLLKKAIYGTKQASRNWQMTLHKTLIDTHVEEGVLVSEEGREYKIQQGIPNLRLNEDEVKQ